MPTSRLAHRLADHLSWRLEEWRRDALLRSIGRVGVGAEVGPHVVVHSPSRLEIGDHSQINDFTLIFAYGGVTIGSHVLISSGCNVTSVAHEKDARLRRSCDQGLTAAPVRIEDDVWIGAGAIVLPGVTIGRGAIVGAGALVSRDVAPGVTVAGIPARPLDRPAVQERAPLEAAVV